MSFLNDATTHVTVGVWHRTLSHLGNSGTTREWNQASGVSKEHYAQYYVRNSSILLAGTGVGKISSLARGFNPIKIDYSDNPKSYFSRIFYFFEKKRLL